MATAPDPDEVLRSTRGKENFQRISRLLISGGTTLLREIFDQRCPPSNFPTILKHPTTEKQLKAAKLTKPQWDCLYPSPGVYGKSADFDVTLLFRLLRTICNLVPPATGWDALPTSTDQSLAADLARIRHYRNSVFGHVNQNMEIADDQFPVLWQDISEVLVRIAGQISPTKKPQWLVAIFNFLRNPLTAEDERNVQELLEWYRNDMEVKESIEELKTSMKEMQDGMERLETSLKGVDGGIEEISQVIGEKVQCLETAVREESQDIKDQLEREIKSSTQEVQSLEKAVREESQEIKDQLGGELKTTSQDVQSLEKAVREESQDIKDQLGEMHQSIDRLSSSAGTSQAAGARLRLWIECKTISGPGQQGGPTSEIALASQEHEAGVPVPEGFPSRSREPASEIVMASQEQETGLPGQGMTMVPMTSRERKADTSFPTAQQVLNLAASKYLTTIDPSKPEELNGFVCYLEKVRKTLIIDTQSGSLIITVECRSLEMLDELWSDYCTGFLNEMAQIFLVTEEVLRELGLIEVKLTTTILEEEYRACREYLLQHSAREKMSSSRKSEEEDTSPSDEALEEVNNHIKEAFDILKRETKKVRMEKEALDEAAKRLEHVHFSTMLKLNVGGHLFSTSLATLNKDPGSMLHAMFSGRFDTKPGEDGSYFIDRDGTHFRYILNYLRTGQLVVPEDKIVRKELLTEAEFYQIEGIINELKARPFKDSVILPSDHQQTLIKWLKETLTSASHNYVLIYRASRNGWAAANFHSFCDNKGPTVTVVKSGNYIFGGYTEQPWESGPGVYRKAPGSFLFSLVNPSGLPPTTLPLIAGKEGNAILCNGGYGPVFGGAPDFRIPNVPNSSNCYVNLNNTYQCPTGQNNATFFTGSQNFTIAEMEVFVFEK